METPTSDSSVPNPEEAVLAEFILELEKRGHVRLEEVVTEFVERHPELPSLSDALRKITKALPVLEASRPEPAEWIPSRLGECDIRRQIDHGGMGRIYEAWHERLRRRT